MATAEERLFFALWFRLNPQDGYLIWILEEPESVLVEEDLLIPVFRSEITLAKYAHEKGIEIVNEEPILHHLDVVKDWLDGSIRQIDCLEFLSAWNLFNDVAQGLNLLFTGTSRDKLTRQLYDKLFFGNNIPGIAQPDDYYIPLWTSADCERLSEIMTEGMHLFERNIKVLDNGNR